SRPWGGRETSRTAPAGPSLAACPSGSGCSPRRCSGGGGWGGCEGARPLPGLGRTQRCRACKTGPGRFEVARGLRSCGVTSSVVHEHEAREVVCHETDRTTRTVVQARHLLEELPASLVHMPHR